MRKMLNRTAHCTPGMAEAESNQRVGDRLGAWNEPKSSRAKAGTARAPLAGGRGGRLVARDTAVLDHAVRAKRHGARHVPSAVS
mmetsp:Transcript_1430/g.3054  ORF Transcript_1430/g.3054 Transcript_1430/m.3054 type:complete len:84 (+) Transcript_1430:1118-1369(+)